MPRGHHELGRAPSAPSAFRRSRLGAGLAVCLAGLAGQAGARADEGELTLVAAPAYGLAVVGQGGDGRSLSGGGGAALLRYGLSETLALHAQAGAQAGAGAAHGAAATYGAGLGLTYAMDLLRVVPFFEAGLGVLGTRPAPGPAAALALSLGLGAEYVVSSRWSVGGTVRCQVALSDPGALPLALQVGPHVSIRLR